MNQPIALITGASSGFGEGIARLLAQKGYALILNGRREDKLESLALELSTTPTYLMVADVRDRKEVEHVVSKFPEEWKNIDVLVNNAGLALGLNALPEGDPDDWDTMLDTNVKGLLYVTRAITPLMIARGQGGHVINIGSVAGYEVYPKGGVYCASKHAVAALTDGMRIDMLPHKIRVTEICPGMAHTEFSLVRYKGDEERADNVYAGITPLYAQDVAEVVYFAISRPAHVNIARLTVMPSAQASARDTRRDEVAPK